MFSVIILAQIQNSFWEKEEEDFGLNGIKKYNQVLGNWIRASFTLYNTPDLFKIKSLYLTIYYVKNGTNFNVMINTKNKTCLLLRRKYNKIVTPRII